MLRPNPPRMITVLIAVALLAIGLGLTWLEPRQVRDIINLLPLPDATTKDLLRLAREDSTAYAFLAAAPLLLAVGSLLPGI
jgi:hypothetical protein